MIEGLSKKQLRIIGSVVFLYMLSLMFQEFNLSRKTTFWHGDGETKSLEGPSKREKDHLNRSDYLKHGIWTEWYKNGQKEEEGNWKIVSLPSPSDLKLHGSIKDGLWTGWYENGQKSYEGTWKKTDSLRTRGATDGLWTYWYENGQKSKEITYKDGDRIGLWTGWYENGHKQWEENYIHINTVDTGIYYTEDGSIKEPIPLSQYSRTVGSLSNYSGPLYRYLRDNGYTLNVYTMKVGNNEDGLSTHWYRNTNNDYKFVIKNGQKSSEGTTGTFSGRIIGIWTYWYENGQKKEEGTYSKDGIKDGLWTGWYENGQKKEEVTYKAGRVFDIVAYRLVDISKVISQECWDAEGNERKCPESETESSIVNNKPQTQPPPGKVWSPEHGHWHNK